MNYGNYVGALSGGDGSPIYTLHAWRCSECGQLATLAASAYTPRVLLVDQLRPAALGPGLGVDFVEHVCGAVPGGAPT